MQVRPSPSPGKRSYLALLASALIAGIGFGATTPVQALYAKSLGATTTVAGLVVGVIGGARILGNIPSGLLSDRFGLRLVIILGGLLRAVGAFLWSVSRGVSPLYVASLAVGFGGALRWTACLTAIPAISPPGGRGRAMSGFLSCDLIGFGLGPVLGGFVAQRFGLNVPFLVSSFTELVAAAVILAWFAGPQRLKDPVTTPRPPAWAGASSLFRNPLFSAIAMLQFGYAFTAMAIVATLGPLIGTTRAGLDTSQLGAVMTAGSVFMLAAISYAGKQLDRQRGRPTVLAGLLIASVALVMMCRSRSLVSFAAALFPMMIGGGLIAPVPPAYASGMAAGGRVAMTMGMLQTVGECGYFSGPALLGLMTDLAGGRFEPALLCSAGLLLVTGAFFGFATGGRSQAATTGDRRRVKTPDSRT